MLNRLAAESTLDEGAPACPTKERSGAGECHLISYLEETGIFMIERLLRRVQYIIFIDGVGHKASYFHQLDNRSTIWAGGGT